MAIASDIGGILLPIVACFMLRELMDREYCVIGGECRSRSINRMTSISSPATTYKYNSLGERWEATRSGVTTRFLYVDGDLLQELDTSGNVVVAYNPGIFEIRNSTISYYDHDMQGNTAATTNSSGTLTADKFVVGAYGDPIDVSASSRYQYGGNHGYYTDSGTGLMKLGARYYDPTIGRFITKDPARDGANWYVYAGDDPVNAVDPSGFVRRSLSELQEQFVNRAISYIDHTPNYQGYAQDLRHMFDAGHIAYNDDHFGGYTAFGPASISNYIELGSMYSDDNLGGMTPFRGALRLASTLVHEQTHNIQGGIANLLNLPACELYAYGKQQNFFSSLGQAMTSGMDNFWGTGTVLQQRRQGLSDVHHFTFGEAKEELHQWGLDYRIRPWGFK